MLLQPKSIESLIFWFESVFDCEMGMPYSRTETGKEYVEYALRSNIDTPEIIRALVENFSCTFSKELADHPELIGSKLYWRLPKKIELNSSVDGGVVIYTRLVISALEKIKGLHLQKLKYLDKAVMFNELS